MGLSDVIDVGFKQDVDVIPVGAEFTGNPAIAGVMVVRHGLLSVKCNSALQNPQQGLHGRLSMVYSV